MAAAVLAQCDPAVPVTRVHATRGKYLRAEPVSPLYARGLVHHVGASPTPWRKRLIRVELRCCAQREFVFGFPVFYSWVPRLSR